MAYFGFSAPKMIEAAATLLRREADRQMDKKRLLALLYMADRQSLQETGRPVIGGRLVAMPYGPIHSEALDLINGVDSDDPAWFTRFQLQGYRIRLIDDPGSHHLSRYEVDLLVKLHGIYAGRDTWDVANLTHAFPEYEKTYLNGTSKTISLELLIDETGRGNDKQAILNDAREKQIIDSQFPERNA
jgi:uncharacterized phage-associated protein